MELAEVFSEGYATALYWRATDGKVEVRFAKTRLDPSFRAELTAFREGKGAQVTIKFNDARKGTIILDVTDAEAGQMG